MGRASTEFPIDGISVPPVSVRSFPRSRNEPVVVVFAETTAVEAVEVMFVSRQATGVTAPLFEIAEQRILVMEAVPPNPTE
jgi:hypothetical protein